MVAWTTGWAACSIRQAALYAVIQEMVEQWTADLEVPETALGDPFAPSPYCASSEQAQTAVDHLRAMWSELEEVPEELPFMQVSLLSKKLRCIDQLRPADAKVEGQPAISWQVACRPCGHRLATAARCLQALPNCSARW